MAAAAALLQLDEKESILDLVYSNFNTEELNGLTVKQLQDLHGSLRDGLLNITQVEASMNSACACPFLCDREELFDVLNEMDRRYYLAKDLQWEFALLDHQRKGAISESNMKFLFQMVYGEFFSKFKFERMMKARRVPNSDVSFEEVEVELCNIPTHDWIEELIIEEEREREEKEFQMREAERKRKESEEAKKREEGMVRQLEEEDKKRKAFLERRKQEEIERKRLEEENELKKQAKEMGNAKRIEEKKKQEKEEAEREARGKKAKELEATKIKKREKEELELKEKAQKEEERLKLEKEQQEKLEAENEKEKLRLAQEEQEKIEQEEKEKLEPEQEAAALAVKASTEEKEKRTERALGNWRTAKQLGLKELQKGRTKRLLEVKAKLEAEQAAREEQSAEAAAEAENQGEVELEEADLLLQQATNDEEHTKAEQSKNEAEAKVLKNKEKRLRYSLKAAVNLRKRPKIDATVVEAKEAEIPALNPDIAVAEKVSDSLKCIEELEDAMVKRNLQEIESAVEKIKKRGYESEHAVQLSDADKLIQKLRRLEKLKKEILALDQRTISEIRSYQKPNIAIQQVMIAVYIILGYKEKELKEWKHIQALLGRTGKEGLKRMCTTLEASKVDMNAVKIADKKYLGNHELDTITEISAGAGTFFVWSTAMIDEARSWNEDSEFRKKVEEKRREEEEEAKRLQEENNKLRTSKKPVNQKPANQKPANQNAQAKSRGSSSSRGKKAPDSSASSRSRSNLTAGAKQRGRSGSPKVKKK